MVSESISYKEIVSGGLMMFYLDGKDEHNMIPSKYIHNTVYPVELAPTESSSRRALPFRETGL
jgi:hypothetical protein